jgi:hypothetical protein
MVSLFISVNNNSSAQIPQYQEDSSTDAHQDVEMREVVEPAEEQGGLFSSFRIVRQTVTQRTNL